MFKVGDKVVWQNPVIEEDIAVGRITRVHAEWYGFRENVTEYPILAFEEELVKLA